MNRPIRQHPEPLPADLLRIIESIALALAQEHHAAENAGKSLFADARLRSDGAPRISDAR
jgi:hypothetical protein